MLPVDPSQLWVSTKDGNNLPSLLGAPPHVGPSGTILRFPIKSIPRDTPGGPTLPHHLKHGGGFPDPALDYYGHRGGGRTCGFWEGS